MFQMRRGITMNMGACIGYQSPLINHPMNDSNHDTQSKHDQTFFDGNNYGWIIQCLNDGYGVATDVIEFMEDYNNHLQTQIRELNAYSKKWYKRLNSRPPLSSYSTTKSAQIDTVTSTRNSAKLIRTLCDAIQEVINSYKRQVDRMYPKERLGFGHKHYESEEMEKLFKDAYSDREKVVNKLQRLRNDEKVAQEAVSAAKGKYECFDPDDTTSKNQSFKAKNRLEKKKNKLQAIETRIARTKVEYNEAQGTYRRKATAIYKQCRSLEEERLNQIRETLIAFNRAIHSTEYSNNQNAIHEKLVLKIESEQNTRFDLNSWAETYHVISSPQRTLSDIGENEEDRTVADQPIATQAKLKLKPKKSTGSEPKTPQ